jgi:hypothetical protein
MKLKISRDTKSGWYWVVFPGSSNAKPIYPEHWDSSIRLKPGDFRVYELAEGDSTR